MVFDKNFDSEKNIHFGIKFCLSKFFLTYFFLNILILLNISRQIWLKCISVKTVELFVYIIVYICILTLMLSLVIKITKKVSKVEMFSMKSKFSIKKFVKKSNFDRKSIFWQKSMFEIRSLNFRNVEILDWNLGFARRSKLRSDTVVENRKFGRKLVEIWSKIEILAWIRNSINSKSV